MATSRHRHVLSPTLTGALLLVVATVGADVILGPDWVLTPLLIAGPLVAAASGPARHSIYAGVAGVLGAFVLGFSNEIEFTRRHYVSMITVVLGTVMGYELARRRERREHQLTSAQPKVDQATRLVRAMHSGRMGEWRVDRVEGRIRYDEEVARVFGRSGVDPDGFVASGWSAVVDERDRATVLSVIERAFQQRTSFRFDHRCLWPDGTTHWLEVVGEPIFDGDELIGAQGLVWNVDERYRKLDERARLLDLEHYARLRAEYVARVHDVLSRSVDVAEILDHVTRAAVPDLADWCNAVFVMDRPQDTPLVVTAHRDPQMEAWARGVLERFPYDPEAGFGAARVIREGRRELIEHVAAVVPTRNQEQHDILAHGAVDKVLTVPIPGQVGLLGSLQLVRGRERTSFTPADIELAEELASRCGAALNSAVLLARQRTSSEALETLQRVSGWLARAVTRRDVASATVTHGAEGLRAHVGSVFVLDEASVLVPMASVGVADPTADRWMLEVAHQAVDADPLVVSASGTSPVRTALAVPLRILDRSVGVMVFTFDGRRGFAQEELAMAVTLASRCAGALERASFYERERQSVLMLQRRLLPQVPPIPAWLEVGYCYEPASGGQVGGDWFQLINVDDDRVVAVVGDAVGHGMSAAAAMGQLKSSIATAVSIDPDPAEVLRIVDRFADAGTETLAATAVATMLDRCGTYRLAAAGHPPPVLVHAGGGTAVLEGGRRPLLGYGEGRQSAAEQRHLVAGDLMVLYSDGLVERRNELLDVGIERLQRILVEMRDQAPQTVCDALIDRLGDDTQTDDVALLLLRFVGDVTAAR